MRIMSLVVCEYFDLKKARYFKVHKWPNFSILLTECQTNWNLTDNNSAGFIVKKKLFYGGRKLCIH